MAETLPGALDPFAVDVPPRKSIEEVLASLERIHAQILARRGGEPIPVEVIDEILDEIRGRVDVDEDLAGL